MALSDADVQKQIKHMMAFIDQEASEKAEEIDVKAEEEFNIEKGRLVQEQRVKILEFYSRKEKQVELQKKIQSSNLLNQARLQVLKNREDHIKAVLEDAHQRLAQIAQEKHKYKIILEGLIIQGLYQLIEPHVFIKCRSVDSSLITDMLPKIIESYKSTTHNDIKITIDKENLGADTSGGVELYAQKGKLKVVNTMESRLDMISQQMLPELREIMFGKNVNRRFMN